MACSRKDSAVHLHMADDLTGAVPPPAECTPCSMDYLLLFFCPLHYDTFFYLGLRLFKRMWLTLCDHQ